jgi:hypothetical protein
MVGSAVKIVFQPLGLLAHAGFEVNLFCREE